MIYPNCGQRIIVNPSATRRATVVRTFLPAFGAAEIPSLLLLGGICSHGEGVTYRYPPYTLDLLQRAVTNRDGALEEIQGVDGGLLPIYPRRPVRTAAGDGPAAVPTQI